MTQEDQLIADLGFCVDDLELNDDQIGLYLRAAEEIGVSCRYMAEEFVFESDTLEEFERLHLNPDYLKIDWRLN